MARITISAKSLSKRFGMYSSPARRLAEILCPFRSRYRHEIWALKDISFEVAQGRTLGIIGSNGSGKSTLLQILCGIFRPTSGEVTVNGRVSALLELGAGFHPEFTGRDNVYMNGAIMNLSRREMDERFQAVEEFADIGEFIDQPVRTYSSGMFVRLAFSCAVNVNPDIMIVDEALAVGDEHFQRKCRQKIMEFRDKGGTMLFVSHDMQAVREMCDQAILLNKGNIVERGNPARVTTFYQHMKP